MARFMRSYGKSRLRPPAVTGAGIAWHGPGTYLVYPISAKFLNPRAVHSKLRPPIVVTAATTQTFSGPVVHLRKIRPVRTRYLLSPPTVIFGFFPRDLPTTLAPQRRGTPKSRLDPPVVIDLSPQVFYLQTTFVRITPPPTLSFLKPPTDTIGLEDRGRVDVTLSPQSRGKPKSRLAPPVVIDLTPQVKVVSITLAYSRRGAAKSHLFPATVSAAPVIYFGPHVTLTRIRPPRVTYDLAGPIVVNPFLGQLGGIGISLAASFRGKAKSRLSAPTVITVTAGIFFGPSVTISPSKRGQPKSHLAGPVVIFPFFPRDLPVALAPQRRGAPKSRLAPPVDTVGLEDQGKVAAHLTYSKRGAPKSRLSPPTVVAPVLAAPIQTQIVRILPPPTLAILRRPVVVYLAVELSGPEITLAPSTRGKPKSFLRAPVILASNLPTSTTFAQSFRGKAKSRLSLPVVVFTAVELSGPRIVLAPSFRGKAKPHLSPPADITEAEEFPFIRTHLAYSRRGVPKSKLRSPSVVAPVVSYGPAEWLAYSRRGAPKSRLTPPAVVASPPAYSQVIPPQLAYSLRGKAKSFLRPPTVVFPFFARKTDTTFAPQSRGKAKSLLSPPRVVRLAVEIYGPVVRLAPSFRGTPRSLLLPPAVVVRATFAGPSVSLSYSLRGKAKPFLRGPVVVRLAIEIYGPEIHLTRIKPVPTISVLRAPTDISDAQDIGLLKIHLAYSKRGAPKSQLKPPTVIERVFSLGPETHLSPSFRGKPRSQLKPPTVVTEAFSARAIQTHLVRIRPPRVNYLIKPPTVVRAAEAFYGPSTWLIRIRPPRVIHFRLPIVVSPFTPPRGDVCGFDIAGSVVCSLELPGTQVSGSDSTGSQVTGSSAAGSRVSGSESAGGSVSGSDRKAT